MTSCYDIMYCDSFRCSYLNIFFFFNDTATPEIYTLPLHAALPIPRVAPPLEVVAQLVRQCLPRFVAPIERTEPRQRDERPVIQHDTRLQVPPRPGPLEGDAFAERVHVASHGMRYGLGAYLDRDDPVAELGRHAAGD